MAEEEAAAGMVALVLPFPMVVLSSSRWLVPGTVGVPGVVVVVVDVESCPTILTRTGALVFPLEIVAVTRCACF